jgi:hypothetical protein
VAQVRPEADQAGPVPVHALHRARLSRPRARRRRRLCGTDRYGFLLLLLIIGYLLSAFLSGTPTNVVRLVLFVITLVLALRASQTHRRTRNIIVGIALFGALIAAALTLVGRDRLGDGAVNLCVALVLLLVVVLIVRRVVTHEVVTGQTILGAVSAYLIIGMMFASVYGVLNVLSPSGFFAGGAQAKANTLQYFSFTTLTTLGYGDYTAGTSGGQAIAVLEALMGQVFLATLVARLVAGFQPKRARRRQPQVAGRAASVPRPRGQERRLPGSRRGQRIR